MSQFGRDSSVRSGPTVLLVVCALVLAGCGGGGGGGGDAAPTASFTAVANGLTVDVDASACSDAEDSPADLEVRWDWENDGTWDSAWTTTKTASHTYALTGTYSIALQVRDVGGQADVDVSEIGVSELPWVRRDGGTGEEDLSTVATLPDGSVVVAGAFTGQATFGLGEPAQITLVADDDFSPYESDIVVARYGPDGELVWARRAGGAHSDHARGVAVLSDGSAVVAGEFRDVAVFGEGEVTETSLTSDGGSEVFIARYAPNGTLTWARRAGGTESAYANGVVASSSGSLVITGTFHGTATFGPGESGETELTAAVGTDPFASDLFVARYEGDGGLVWAKRAGGERYDHSNRVAALPEGATVITGEFAGTATFGAGEANQTVLTAQVHLDPSAKDVFVARYDVNGSLTWVKRAGGIGFQSAADVAATQDGSVILVTGSFWDDATFGPGESNETQLTTEGRMGIFLARYASDGSLVWAEKALADLWDGAPHLGALPSGGSVVTGYFEGTSTFSPGGPGETSLTSFGHEDLFLARYDAGGALTWVRHAGGGEDDGGREVVLLPDGSPVVVGTFSDTATFDPGQPRETSLTAGGTEEDAFVAKYDPDGHL